MRNSHKNASIAYYVSAHGYGHGVRSCDIVRALNEADRSRRVFVVSDLPQALLKSRLPSPSNTYLPGAFDVGMVQLDSIRVDVAATLERVLDLHGRRRDLIRAVMEFLRGAEVGVVVADIPSIPLEAAAEAGIPAIAVGNFGWDWIYSEFVDLDDRWHGIVQTVAHGYAGADLLLRLPFAEEMRAFRRMEDLPLVSSPGRPRREEIAALCGANPWHRWILLSFTTLDWNETALSSVEKLEDYEFFTVLPFACRARNIHSVDRAEIPFGDLAASVDAVISKPGFGILSDCVVNNKPLIYAERTEFREYHVLERAIRRFLRFVHLPAARLYQGELREALECLDSLPEPPDRIQTGGARIAARRILGFLEQR